MVEESLMLVNGYRKMDFFFMAVTFVQFYSVNLNAIKFTNDDTTLLVSVFDKEWHI